MQKLLAYISLVIILAPSLMNLSVIADYAVRYDYYVNVLCKNKENPVSQCHGKCQLALAEEVNTDDAPAIPKLHKLEIEVLFISDSENEALSFDDAGYRFEVADENVTLDPHTTPDLKPPRV
ncbi:MAG: hypothetical protein HWE14_11025 [Flavobacteriia bacterium]|nr:hypothetical protein [Flavobacteriia bacterium]